MSVLLMISILGLRSLDLRKVVLLGAGAFWFAQLMVPFSYLQFWYIYPFHYPIPGAYLLIAIWNLLLLFLAMCAEPYFFQKPWAWAWGIFVLGSLLPSTFCGVDFRWSLRHWLVFLNRGFLVGFILFFLGAGVKSTERIIRSFYWIVLAMAVAGLIEIFLGKPLLSQIYDHALANPLFDQNPLFRTNIIGVQSIPVAGVGNRIPFASCLVAFFPIALSYWESCKKYSLLGVGFLISVIFLSLARSSYLGVIVASSVYLLGRRPVMVPMRWREGLLGLPPLLLGLILIPKPNFWNSDMRRELMLFYVWPSSLNRMTDLDTAHRLASYQTVFRMIRKYPLGIGLGNYQWVYRKFHAFKPSIETAWWPDNQYLRWMAEAGLLGILLLFAFFGIYAWRVCEGAKAPARIEEANLLWAVFSGVVGLLTCFIFFDGFYWSAPTVTLWALIGLSWAYAEKEMKLYPRR